MDIRIKYFIFVLNQLSNDLRKRSVWWFFNTHRSPESHIQFLPMLIFVIHNVVETAPVIMTVYGKRSLILYERVYFNCKFIVYLARLWWFQAYSFFKPFSGPLPERYMKKHILYVIGKWGDLTKIWRVLTTIELSY